MNDRIPVTIITGFLGAGKTTLLSNLIKDTEDLRFAIVVNEFGEVSIDDAILRQHGNATQFEFHNIAHGLVAYGSDSRFLDTLLALKERCSLIDHVLVETSGLAVPTGVIEVLQDQQLSNDFVLDATIDVIDTPHFLSPDFLEDRIVQGGERLSSLREVFQYQLDCSDVVVLNKIDDLEQEALHIVENNLRRRSPSLRFIELAYHGKLDKNLALGLRLNQSTVQLSNYRTTRSPAIHIHRDGHEHSGLGPHEHGLSTHQHVHDHDPAWVSFALHSHDRQDGSLLKSALQHIATSEQMLRVKGSACLSGVDSPALVQGVRNRIEVNAEQKVVSGNKTARRLDEGAHESELVFIGYHLDRENVAAKLEEFTSTHWH
ncbi:MAG: cobalamin biosynthesis protein P47K [Candidatus Melainabacteria bacterium]|nr:MAG: cobalamin biosynthesis protein P47K [Candidatus Melainabacteria bacterium]